MRFRETASDVKWNDDTNASTIEGLRQFVERGLFNRRNLVANSKDATGRFGNRLGPTDYALLELLNSLVV